MVFVIRPLTLSVNANLQHCPTTSRHGKNGDVYSRPLRSCIVRLIRSRSTAPAIEPLCAEPLGCLQPLDSRSDQLTRHEASPVLCSQAALLTCWPSSLFPRRVETSSTSTSYFDRTKHLLKYGFCIDTRLVCRHRVCQPPNLLCCRLINLD